MKKKILLAVTVAALIVLVLLLLWDKFTPSNNAGLAPSIRKANKFALLVGIKDGQTTWAETDVILARKLLNVGSNPENEFISTDPAICTKANILNRLNDFAKRAIAGDLVYIYITCHGTQVIDYNLDEARVTAGDTKDEAMLLYGDELLIDDEMENVFCSFNSGVRVVFIADCCHSGTMMGLSPSVSFDMAPTNVFQDLKAEVIYLGACQDSRLAKTSNYQSYSRFTMVLSQIGRKNTTGNLFDVHSKVRDELNGIQEPSYIEMSAKGICIDLEKKCQVIDPSFRNQIAFK